MIKNIIFDIGSVILNFDLNDLISKFTSDEEDKKFIIDNIVNSPEWLKYGLIDTGYITREEAIKIVQDRTNHVKDELIYNFWTSFIDYRFINLEVLDLIKRLKSNNYNIYILSNISYYVDQFIKKNGVYELVDGCVLSYKVHKIKPYIGIYEELINKYNLKVSECLFIDDNKKNIATANKLGIFGDTVEPNNYESIISLLKKYNINFK